MPPVIHLPACPARPVTLRAAEPPGPTSRFFHGLAGPWRLRRRIESALPSEPSGDVLGTAVFQPTLAPAVKGPAGVVPSAAAVDYHYKEQGEFRTDSGGRFRVRREYVYGYDPAEDRIDVFFAAGGGARDYPFHSLRFSPSSGPLVLQASKEAEHDGFEGADEGDFRGAQQGRDGREAHADESGEGVNGTAALRAPGSRWWYSSGTGQHRCDQDMHYVSYMAGFCNAVLGSFEVSYTVRGPNVNYVATALYCRDMASESIADAS